MTDEAAFLKAIVARPHDDHLRLVYADWLEEHGDEPRAAFLRLEVEFAQLMQWDGTYQETRWALMAVGKGLPHGWVATVSRVAIESCGLTFRFRCPKRWESLSPTTHPMRRFCETCQKSVHFCTSIGQAGKIASNGGCVAVDHRLERWPDDLRFPDFEAISVGMLVGPAHEAEPAPSLPVPPSFSLRDWWRRLWGRPT